jgi:hypothetical protein
MPKRSSKPPKDPNRLAKFVVDTVTQSTDRQNEEPQKNPAAVALGRLGGLKGGKARASKLSAHRRREIAKMAAQSRWKKS